MISLDSLFNVSYGTSLELNRLSTDENGFYFVSRTAKNNGVSSKISCLLDINPIEAGVITVALGGSVLETFLQPDPFYTGFHIAVLRPRVEMSDAVKLYYCACIRANRYKYSYGRQANRTLKNILIPDIPDIPKWVHDADASIFEGADAPIRAVPAVPELNTLDWGLFVLSDLFDIRKGKRLTKANMSKGLTPFIGSTDSKNGVTAFVGQTAIHQGNTISLSYNGSVAEAFYQPEAFWATDDVNVLYPNFKITPEIALFICTVIRQEKYRFNYGRKWHLERMRESIIRLPVVETGDPDFNFMTSYLQSLPYSSQI